MTVNFLLEKILVVWNSNTVTVLNPWDENYGGESITYAGIQTSGGETNRLFNCNLIWFNTNRI